MKTHTLGLFLRHLALSEEVSRLGTASDRELLAAYELEQGQAAFTELMRRHGPMVLRTCRRVLGGSPDAEDAFQATFVLLACKAGRLRAETAGRLSLGGWLHRVAYQTALDVLGKVTRRKTREREANAMRAVHPDPVAEATWNEVRPILDAELNALPDEPRRLLVACYLQGKTHADAAAELGLPLGSMAWRLEKARTQLAERLVRRGIDVSAALLAVLLGEAARGAGVPARLLVHSVEAARLFQDRAIAAIADPVVQLVKSGLAKMAYGSMPLSLLWASAAGLLAVGLIACQTLLAEPGRTPAESQPAAQVKEPAAAEGAEPTRLDRHGDPLPAGALARLGTMRLRHLAGAQAPVFTPDGKAVLTGGGENWPRLWEVATGKLLREFRELPPPYMNGQPYAAFSAPLLSADGRLLAIRGGPTHNVYLLDTATGKRLREFACQGQPGTGFWRWQNFALSANGRTLAVHHAGGLELWDAASGQLLWRDRDQMPAGFVLLAFSPDGTTLAAWRGAKGVILWEARTGKPLRTLEFKGLVHLTFSPDGRTLAVGSPPSFNREPSSVQLWDVATGQKVRQMSRPEQRSSYLAFSPDGKLIACRSEMGITLWDAAAGQELRTWQVPFDRSPAAFSPDGKLVAAYDGLLVHFWETASGKPSPTQLPVGHEGAVNTIAFMPDGKTLISAAADQTLRWWDAGTGQERRNLPCTHAAAQDAVAPKDPRLGQLCTMALSRNGARLAVATMANRGPAVATSVAGGMNVNAGIRLLDPATGKELRRLDSGNGRITSLAFSPDGATLAEAFAGGRTRPTVRQWDPASGQRREPAVEGSGPLFSPDGRYLVTLDFAAQATVQTMFRFREAATGKDVHSFSANEFIRCCALSPDGTALATGSDQIRVYPVSWKPEIRVGSPRVLAASLGTVTALAFSADGRLLAASGNDSILHVWEMVSGQERLRFLPGCGVRAAAFTADSRRLASGGADSTILVWDLTGRLVDGRLRAVNLSTEELEKCWAALASTDAGEARRALWTLAATPSQTVPFLREQLRASAADIQARLAQVPQFLRELDAKSFAVRDKAKAELTRLGTLAEPAVREALANPPSLEARRSLEQLLKMYAEQSAARDTLRGARAVEVLEQIGSAAARAVLQAGASGDFGAQVTSAARTALQRANN